MGRLLLFMQNLSGKSRRIIRKKTRGWPASKMQGIFRFSHILKALLVFAGCLWYSKTRFFVYTKGRLSKI